MHSGCIAGSASRRLNLRHTSLVMTKEEHTEMLFSLLNIVWKLKY